MTQALVGTLSATQTRLAEGIADAEAELVRARARCRELRETLALARAREAAAVVTPVRDPDVRERQKRVRIAELTEGILASQHVAGRTIPRRWLPALISIMRLDVDRFPKIFTRNTVLQWSGGGLLAGLHLGSAQATGVATELAAHIQPGSIRVDELTGSEENLDVLARATFFAEGAQPPTLETTIHGVFRFDCRPGRAAVPDAVRRRRARSLPAVAPQPAVRAGLSAAQLGRGASLHSRSRS